MSRIGFQYWTNYSIPLLYPFIVFNGFATYESHLEFNLVFILWISRIWFVVGIHISIFIFIYAYNFLCNKICALTFQKKLGTINFILKGTEKMRKEVGRKWFAFDRSPFMLFSPRFLIKSVQAPSCESPETTVLSEHCFCHLKSRIVSK